MYETTMSRKQVAGIAGIAGITVTFALMAALIGYLVGWQDGARQARLAQEADAFVAAVGCP